MYTWDIEKGIKEVEQFNRLGNNAIYIKENVLKLITKKAIELNSLEKALKTLLNQKVIDDRVCISTYRKNLKKLDDYKKWRQAKNNERQMFIEQVVTLNNAGFDVNTIAEKTNNSYSSVWNILNRYNKPKIKKKSQDTELAKLTVAYWNKYHFEGQKPTAQTIEAFKILGLEPPKV
jgi:hypothetical protein